MHARTYLLTVVLAAAGCGGTSPTPAPGTDPPEAATPTAPPATVAATDTPAASILEGTWVTEETTCAQQHGAVEAAGFTADQMTAAGWDAETCGDLMHGSQFTVRFSGDRLVAFNDGVPGWEGQFRIVDQETFEAGDSAADFYLTYEFAVDGDELTIDMVRDDYPTTSPDELAGEQVAQTVIYESAPFIRQP